VTSSVTALDMSKISVNDKISIENLIEKRWAMQRIPT